jgi:sugar lactone lactonase YvrE
MAMPVQRPTSCAFGGPAFDRLLITSARIGLDEGELDAQPLAGALFMATPAVGGLPQPVFAN